MEERTKKGWEELDIEDGSVWWWAGVEEDKQKWVIIHTIWESELLKDDVIFILIIK